MKNVQQIIPNLTWFSNYVCCLFAFLYYNLKRRKLLHFFKQSAKFEKSQSILHGLVDTTHSTLFNEKRLAIFMYSSYLIMTCSAILSIFNAVKKTPDAPFLLSHYATLRDALTMPVVMIIHLTGIFISWIMFSLLDVVPGIVFYCAGKQIESIEQQLTDDFDSKLVNPHNTAITSLLSNNQFKTEFCIRLRQTWFKYEALFDLIAEANRTFGILMFLDHGIKFFLTCSLTFMALSYTEDVGIDKMTVAGIAGAFSFRFVVGLLPAAHLHSSSSNLLTTASSLLSKHFYKMTQEEREVVVLLIERLRDHQLTASPLGLYCVTNSILLTVLSLTVSYVIILVQLK